MNVAFYAPLTPCDHPTPSGERLMARLLVKALGVAGHDVRVASDFRSYSNDPDIGIYHDLKSAALTEASRLVEAWSAEQGGWRPDCWFTYHPYYKSPDWIGPRVCGRIGLPYVTAEASYAAKRDEGPWAPWQADVVTAVRGAAVNFCFTGRDRAGLEALGALSGPLVDLPPFLDPPPIPPRLARSSTAAPRLAVAAMMRPGDKLASYFALSQTLQTLLDLPWRLAVIGDGDARSDVLAAFSPIPPDRIDWLGELEPEAVLDVLSACDLYVWPGIGEAYGMAYLEAQAMGLPVVAQDTGGVPAVVAADATGLLTPAGDLSAFAGAIRRLLLDPDQRNKMGHAATRFVREQRSIAGAAAILRDSLARIDPAEHRARP